MTPPLFQAPLAKPAQVGAGVRVSGGGARPSVQIPADLATLRLRSRKTGSGVAGHLTSSAFPERARFPQVALRVAGSIVGSRRHAHFWGSPPHTYTHTHQRFQTRQIFLHFPV